MKSISVIVGKPHELAAHDTKPDENNIELKQAWDFQILLMV